MSMRILAALAATTAIAAPIALAVPARFASPLQPWASKDGEVNLLRPLAALPQQTDEPLSTLMSPGWRLVWDGSAMQPGQVVVRLVLKVRPAGQPGTANEVLQVGRSRDPRVVGRCLTYGLAGGSGRRLPDRVINGRRYAAWTNGDAGMSHSIAALDLRTVVRGTCFAVERFRYGESASDGDPRVRLSAAQGAALLDASLGSLQLGRLPAARIMRPQSVSLPAGAVAR